MQKVWHASHVGTTINPTLKRKKQRPWKVTYLPRTTQLEMMGVIRMRSAWLQAPGRSIDLPLLWRDFPQGSPLVTPGTPNLENNPKRDLVYEPNVALPGQRPHSAHDWGFVILFEVATLKIHMSPGSPYITVSSHGAVASISSSQRQGLGAHTPDPTPSSN